MSNVAKVIELVGTSQTSWQDAADTAVKAAAKTIRNNQITAYGATVKIAFAIEESLR